MLKNEILSLINQKINVKFVDVKDLTKLHKKHQLYKSGGHFKLIIVSYDFNSMTLINRHKMIYSILKNLMANKIHALSIHAFTPDEYLLKKNRL